MPGQSPVPPAPVNTADVRASRRRNAGRRARGAWLLLLALAVACGEGPDAAGRTAHDPAAAERDDEVLVFAAASMRESLVELARGFERETGTRAIFNFAGSNDLAHQIEATRGMDLYLSASEAWMDTVQNAGRLVPATRRDLLSNTLVVIGNTRAAYNVAAPCSLAELPFRHLSLGDPDAVPAGTYARTWLRGQECDGRSLWDAVADRVAPAPDVRAALGLVLADPRVIGIVYRTDQLAFADRSLVLYQVRDGPAIRYTLAQVRDGANPDAARRFYAYLISEGAAIVFQRHGFSPLRTVRP